MGNINCSRLCAQSVENLTQQIKRHFSNPPFQYLLAVLLWQVRLVSIAQNNSLNSMSSAASMTHNTSATPGGAGSSSNSIMNTADYDGSSQDAWRKPGRVFRARLLKQDEEEGGNHFVLSPTCSIRKYFDVADRVSWRLGVLRREKK